MMKLKLILILFLPVFIINNIDAQKSLKKFTVSGYVKDINDNPLGGTMILLDNKNTGKVTNDHGYYRVKVKSDNKIISVFTMNGASTGIPIEGRTSISFILEESSFIQNNIHIKKESVEVVNTGYGYIKKDHYTQSADKINMTETDYSSFINIYDLLRSKFPGVEVIGEKVYIRGSSTLVGGTDPLFIVDGVFVQSIGFIHPGIVKSVDVLKGNAASAYGVNGSNGVIIINTIR
ncbi:MAG: TonB-dependent receptor plug domain-containing protein [Bacteroidota bacterium]